MSRGRVLIISPYQVEYGPPRNLEHAILALESEGYDAVCVVRKGARINPRAQERDPRIHVVDELSTIPRTLKPGRLASFLQNHLVASRAIERIAAEENARMIYSISEAIFCGGLAARRLGIPSMAHVIGMSIKSPRLVGRSYTRFLARMTTRFVACSSAVAEMLLDLGVPEERIAVVHNAIPVAEIDETEGLPSPIDHQGPRVGMIAAYDPRKGHELFVEAAAEIVRAYPATRFYLIGGVLANQPDSIAFERAVRRLIAARGLDRHFERTGYVPPPDIYRWIRAMDVVVVPSKTEAFGFVQYEAMVCRRPVVATGVEGNLDAFIHGHSGVYVEPSARPLAQAVSELLADPERAAAIGEAARRRVRQFFDEQILLPALSQTIAQTLNEARTPW
jgi:glycosyltransferase involved in cell wall biosynthesis